MKASEKIREITQIFRKNNLTFNEKEAETIVLHVIKTNRVKLYSHDPEIQKDDLQKIDNLIKRRLKREPLQYILGECDFFNIKIKVAPGVLIPRPETEILVEEFLRNYKKENKKNALVLDLCTGSGAIALAIAKNLSNISIFGIDISERAVRYAKINKELNHINSVFFIVGDLFLPVKKNKFSFITANPPYIKTSDIEHLEPEIRKYEPLEALNGGSDGLIYYRRILEDANDYLLNDGLIFFEIGIGQSLDITKLSEKAGFEVIKIVNDLAGIPRVMILKKS